MLLDLPRWLCALCRHRHRALINGITCWNTRSIHFHRQRCHAYEYDMPQAQSMSKVHDVSPTTRTPHTSFYICAIRVYCRAVFGIMCQLCIMSDIFTKISRDIGAMLRHEQDRRQLRRSDRSRDVSPTLTANHRVGQRVETTRRLVIG